MCTVEGEDGREREDDGDVMGVDEGEVERRSLFPPPPAVSSTLICRPSSSDWCKRSAACSAGRVENSRNAQPLDLDLDLLATVAPARVALGVSRRTVGV